MDATNTCAVAKLYLDTYLTCTNINAKQKHKEQVNCDTSLQLFTNHAILCQIEKEEKVKSKK